MSKIVVIDPGHGGKDPGACANGLKEKDIVLKISKYAKDYLEDGYEGVKVYLTRSTDVFLELSERAKFANNKKADLFVSNHINAGGGTGFESYVYTTINGGTTEKMRSAVHNEVMTVYKGFRDRGKKKANLAVVRETAMEAMLLEHLFIDTKKDADFLKLDDNLKAIAKAEANGIAKALGLKPKTVKKEAPKKEAPKKDIPKKDGKLSKVQVGAFADPKNAEKLAAELKKKGYKPFITKE
ncbi:N-acetylmuramoyl-L-alanine amidase [Heyndrickxia sporothermodurans]|uniref:N-acetylmuramoyl-L-alanine amidase n=1 Tax=Heyndrickxia sporothermodurans TaxID=46224 RepID=UPI002E1F901C|nr:N-acetylmuramoyl-L-alanine amidase [Heyndrickxia sporothermodurans]MED3697361.1 N-acetylmuramoyl-L-alanine amidase [Heyndrickxia sporothermodurans]